MNPPSRRLRRLLTTGLAATAVGALGVAAPSYAGTANGGIANAGPNPIAGLSFSVDRATRTGGNHGAFALAAHYRSEKRFLYARWMSMFANTSTTKWFGTFTDHEYAHGTADSIRKYLNAVTGGHPESTITPVATFRLPNHESCNVATTVAQANSYKRWINEFARGIGNSARVVAFIEPDGLVDSTCLSHHTQNRSLGLMAYAANKLGTLKHTTVYLEGGGSDWESFGSAVSLLKRAGVLQRTVRGFVLGVTHYRQVRYERAFGDRLSRALHHKHYVIDTSDNGTVRGHQNPKRNSVPPSYRPYHNLRSYWCNPPYLTFGPLPSTRTGDERNDGYLWVNRIWLSDGLCKMSPSSHRGPTNRSVWGQRILYMVDHAAWLPKNLRDPSYAGQAGQPPKYPN